MLGARIERRSGPIKRQTCALSRVARATNDKRPARMKQMAPGAERHDERRSQSKIRHHQAQEEHVEHRPYLKRITDSESRRLPCRPPPQPQRQEHRGQCAETYQRKRQHK